jgi:hypothetical protein
MTWKPQWVVGAAACLAACNAIDGLDKNYEEVSCFPPGSCPDASATADVYVGSDGQHDASAPDSTGLGDADAGGDVRDTGADVREGGTAEAGDSSSDVIVPPTCIEGTKTCAGLVPQACVNGVWQNGAPCPYVCAAGACTGTCTPGALQCSGQQPQQCDSTGTWQNDGSPCASVCSAGQCSGSCTPGALQCSGLQPQKCDASGTWQDQGSACQYVCSGGNCTGSCVPGATQCSQLTPQTCDATGTWQSGSPCPYLCTGGTCTGSCSPGSTECSNNTPQTCNSSGQWVAGTPCGSNATCGSNNTCSCNQGTLSCGGVCATCNTPANAQPTCSGTTCSYTCLPGYNACNGGCSDFTDAANCGACGHSCQGGQCSPTGTCEPIVVSSTPEYPGYIATDGTNVYWSTTTTLTSPNQQAQLFSCPTGGCSSPTKLYSVTGNYDQIQSVIAGVGSTSSELFFGFCGSNCNVYSIPKTGGAVGGVLTSLVDGPAYFAYDSGHNQIYLQQGQSVLRVNPDGTGKTTAMSAGLQEATGVFTDTKNFYVTDNSNGTGGFVVYAALGSTNATGTPVITGLGRPTTVYSDGSNLWITDFPSGTSGAVYKCPIGGTCSASSPFAASQTGPNGILTDANYVYWSNWGAQAIVKCPLAGCPASGPIHVADVNVGYAGQLVQDSTFIYWATYTQIVKVAK